MEFDTQHKGNEIKYNMTLIGESFDEKKNVSTFFKG
jgi:hypothetical protein